MTWNLYSSCLILLLQVAHPDGKTVPLEWDRSRVFDKEVVQMFLGMIKAADSARYVVGTHDFCDIFTDPLQLSHFDSFAQSSWMIQCFNLFYFLSLRVTDVVKKEKTKPRPQALNTVEMLRIASSSLGKRFLNFKQFNYSNWKSFWSIHHPIWNIFNATKCSE